MKTLDTSIESSIRTVIAAHAKLEGDARAIGSHADLYAAGMTSHSTVNVMLALEDEFDIEFPERMLRKATFGTIAGIAEVVSELRAEAM